MSELPKRSALLLGKRESVGSEGKHWVGVCRLSLVLRKREVSEGRCRQVSIWFKVEH